MEVEESSRITLMKQFLTELCDYRVSPSSDDNHIRSTIVGNYIVNPEDVEGEVINWSLQYLEQRKCPPVLTLAISKCIAEQLKEFVGKENKMMEGAQNTGSGLSMDAVHLHSKTIHNLHDLCDHWREHPDQLLKYTTDIKEDPYFTSVCAIKNIRRKMEDRYTIIHNLNLVCGLKDAPHYCYYGVFDGHAGTRAANYAAAHLHSNIAHHPAFLSDPQLAIKEGFKMTDNQILERSSKENTKSGCTVVCSFLNETALHVAWVGDSQAILVRQGIPYIITNPHKPDRQDERQRIENLHGYVVLIGTWRVNGTLAVSRALGDPEHKPYVSAEADVVTIPLEGNEDFFVLACDGLWDRLNPSDVASAVYSHIVEHPPNEYDEVASRLVLQAKEHGSGDNITAIVVFLKDPKELAANPKNPPPYSLQLNGSKVDNWCQGSWNGIHENDNSSNSTQYVYPEGEFPVKPNSLGDLSKPVDIDAFCQMENFQFNPVTCEAGRSYGNDESKNICHSSMNNIMPEATAFSELPTPPIDELLASQQFGEQDKVSDITDTLSTMSETANNKSSSCVTLVDSGILEQDYAQVKQSDFTSQDSHPCPLGSSNDQNDELLSADTAVEMASEIVNNAIELAVNQVMVRTSSQMSQHFDDSGLEEGPLEESDVSPVSASPECDAKHTNEPQELISFNSEGTGVLSNEGNIKSEVSQNDYLKQQQLYMQTLNVGTTEANEPNSSLVNERDQSMTTPDCESVQNYIDQFQSITSKQASAAAQENIEAHPLSDTCNLLDFDLTENSKLNADPTESAKSTSCQNEESDSKEEHAATVTSLEQLNSMTEVLDTITNGSAESLPSVPDSLLQPSNEDTTACISSSLLHSDVGQLLEQLADENKTLPPALSSSLSEELQSGVTPIDLVTIPDEVPEAEGVTEDADSDSEKDGGWSYIQGSKTDLPRQQKLNTSESVAVKSSTTTTKKPFSKPIKKELAKATTETRTSQSKSTTLTQKKSLPEKNDSKDKPLLGTLKATKTTKTTSVVDKTKKPSTAPLKAVPQVAKSGETTTLRPKSSAISSSRMQASRTNAAATQKSVSAVTNLAVPKQQKSSNQRITSYTQTTATTTTTNATKTTVRIQKPASRPPIPTTQKIAARTATSQTLSRPHMQPPKSTASTKISPKSAQDAKQTKESTNKQISSQPSSLPKTKMTISTKTSLPQNPLPSRVASKPTTSGQPTGPPKPLVTKTLAPKSQLAQKTHSTSRPSVKNRVSTVSTAKPPVSKVSKDTTKPTEKPDNLTHQSSEQEKGTKEELTKEIVAENSPINKECALKQENAHSITLEAELGNEAIQK